MVSKRYSWIAVVPANGQMRAVHLALSSLVGPPSLLSLYFPITACCCMYCWTRLFPISLKCFLVIPFFVTLCLAFSSVVAGCWRGQQWLCVVNVSGGLWTRKGLSYSDWLQQLIRTYQRLGEDDKINRWDSHHSRSTNSRWKSVLSSSVLCPLTIVQQAEQPDLPSIQPHWFPFCSSNTASLFPPWGFGICCSLHLECSSCS